jgi:beta-lactamase regulating signal transducer with metallopeptidase domain
MNALLAIAVSNLVVASLIALLALLADRLARRPALTHGLWLLFFLKLLTPPLFPVHVTWSWPSLASVEDTKPLIRETTTRHFTAPQSETTIAEAPIDVSSPVATAKLEPFTAQATITPPSPQPLARQEIKEATTQTRRDAPERESTGTSAASEMPAYHEYLASWPWAELALVVWLIGSLAWFSLASARLLRFRRQLRLARPALGSLQDEAARLARQLGISCPCVWVLPGALSPMLWVLGRAPCLLIPAGLLERLDDEQRQALLVHELAHWRRRDHWVRWLELVALGLYWWCPLVWWARRHLQEAEEECCDAWVVWLMPAAARGYALALVETVDFLAGARPALPPVASGIGQVRLLRRRLTMIMHGTTPRTLTLGGALAVLGVAALLLPLMPTWAQPTPDALAQQPGAGAPQGFPRGPFPPAGDVAQATPESRESVASQQQALARTMRDIQRMQTDLDRSRQELERHAADLQQKMAAIQRQATELSQRFARMPQADDGQHPPAPGGGGGFGGGVRGGGGFAGGGGMGGRPGMPGNTASDIDRRLQQVERKLDMLIQMMQNGPRPPIGPAPAVPPPARRPENRSLVTPPDVPRYPQPNVQAPPPALDSAARP